MRSRSRRAPRTRKVRRAKSVSRPSIRAREKVSCVGARVEIVTASLRQNWASRTCRAWQGRRRCCVRRTRRTIWAAERRKSVLHGGARATCASKIITALCRARSGGRAGRPTWAGQRTPGFDFERWGGLQMGSLMVAGMRSQLLCGKRVGNCSVDFGLETTHTGTVCLPSKAVSQLATTI